MLGAGVTGQVQVADAGVEQGEEEVLGQGGEG